MSEALSAGVSEFRCQAGYFTLEGSSLLLPAIKKCAAEGASIQMLIGSNECATLATHVSYLAGILGVPQPNVDLGVVSFEQALFHPKVYHFLRGDGSQTAYVGSANLTGPGIGGLNVEAGVILDTKYGDEEEVLQAIVERIRSWFRDRLPGFMPIGSASDIEELLLRGYLALKSDQIDREPAERSRASETKAPPRARLTSIFELPTIDETAYPARWRRVSRLPASEGEHHRFLLATEASFHYPQGTHLGHILAILWYFSGNREGTAFDDTFIRLSGSLGAGRIAAYRRQVKYKLVAAIELGLITDIRLAENDAAYRPELTEDGRRLWELQKPFIDTSDLVIGPDDEGEYSSTTPKQAVYYNRLMQGIQARSKEAHDLYMSVMLNMPAVQQMLQLLYHQERTTTVRKARIYETFFTSRPVIDFCDAVGIELQTLESAKHRCPFLINILESCQIVEQSTHDIEVKKLALSKNMLIAAGERIEVGERRLSTIRTEWGTGRSSLPPDDLAILHSLFGESFLTDRYYLTELLEVTE
ncbi:MAG: restriction endonuclease PLD domain-containing protein [Methylocella sp.]